MIKSTRKAIVCSVYWLGKNTRSPIHIRTKARWEMSQNIPTKQINFFRITPIFQQDITFSKVINLLQNTPFFYKTDQNRQKISKIIQILCIYIY